MCSIKIFKNKDVLSCSLDDTEEVPLHEVDAVVSEESKLSSSDCIILHVESKNSQVERGYWVLSKMLRFKKETPRVKRKL